MNRPVTQGAGESSGPRKRQRFPASRDKRPGARRVVLGLGSNQAAETKIPEAIDILAHTYDLLVKSTRYVGPPEVDPENATSLEDSAVVYTNTSVLIRTADRYPQLRETLRAIEAELGRDRDQSGVVAIDIDILLIEGEVVRDENDRVIVPHADLTAKRHAAIPSSEVAPSLKDPRTGERLAEIAARLA